MRRAGRIAWGLAAIAAALLFSPWARSPQPLSTSDVRTTAPVPEADPPPLAGLGRSPTDRPHRGCEGTHDAPATKGGAAEATKAEAPHDVAVTLRLVRPDGRTLDRATIRVDDDEGRLRPWDPRTGAVDLPEGHHTVEVLGGRFGEWRQPEDFAVEVRSGMAPVEVTLRPWRMIVGHLTAAAGGPSVPAAAHLRTLSRAGEVTTVRSDECRVDVGPPSDGWFCLGQDFELERGSYEVSASPWLRGPVIASREVAVGDEAVVVELALPSVDRSDGVVLTVLDPDGRPHEPDFVGVDVRDASGGGGSGPASRERLGDGQYWIPTLLPGYSGRVPVEVTLSAHSRTLGMRRANVTAKRGATPVVLRFDVPAEIRLTLTNRYEWLRDGGDVEAWASSRQGMDRLAQARLSAEGHATLSGLQPGEVRLVLVGRGPAQDLRLGLSRVTLRPGENDVDVPAPPLQTLRVRGADAFLEVQATDGAATQGTFVTLGGKDHVLSLPPGSYTLWSAGRTATVEVPGVPEVTLEEPPP